MKSGSFPITTLSLSLLLSTPTKKGDYNKSNDTRKPYASSTIHCNGLWKPRENTENRCVPYIHKTAEVASPAHGDDPGAGHRDAWSPPKSKGPVAFCSLTRPQGLLWKGGRGGLCSVENRRLLTNQRNQVLDWIRGSCM